MYSLILLTDSILLAWYEICRNIFTLLSTRHFGGYYGQTLHPIRLSAVQPKSILELKSKSSIIDDSVGGVLCILFTHTHLLIPYCTTLARLLLLHKFFCLFLDSCGAVEALNRPTVCAPLYTVSVSIRLYALHICDKMRHRRCR